MNKKLICIECPLGCVLSVTAEGGKLISVSGNKCPKGEKYALQEISEPKRILTSCVLAEGLELKMVPVRTFAPIPKDKLIPAMAEIKKIRLTRPVKAGEAVVKNLLGLGIDLIAGRAAGERGKEDV